MAIAGFWHPCVHSAIKTIYLRKYVVLGTRKLGFMVSYFTVVCLEHRPTKCAITDTEVEGEWVSEIVDDNLYLASRNYHDSEENEQDPWKSANMTDPDDEHQKVMQTGSKALYFAQCRNQNVTWLPLLEKAYAKAHGDYSAIEKGHNG